LEATSFLEPSETAKPVIDVIVPPAVEPLLAPPPAVVVEVVKPEPGPAPDDIPARKGSPRRPRKTAPAGSQDESMAPVLTPPETAKATEMPPAPLLADLVKELTSIMEECHGVRDQLRTVRQDFQEMAGELDEIRNRSRSARQVLQETEGALGELRRTVEQYAPLRQEAERTAQELDLVRNRTGTVRQQLDDAGNDLEQIRTHTAQAWEQVPGTTQELERVRNRAAEIRQQLQEAEGPLAELKQTISTIGEDQKNQSREIWNRFHALQQDSDQVARRLADVRGGIDTLRFNVRGSEEEVGSLGRELNELRGEVEVVRTRVAETGLATQLVREVEKQQLQEILSEPHLSVDESPVPPQEVRLGVTVDADARVLEVLPDSPAEKAGVQPGDVIVNVNHRVIATSEGLREAIERGEAGQDVLLTVRRGTEQHQSKVLLSELAGMSAGPGNASEERS
jgi:uncharacterized coiled-coil DUF342 family protein